MNLEEKILKQYSGNKVAYGQLPFDIFAHHMCCEREREYKKVIGASLGNLNNCKVLEIGAGNGDNLLFLNRVGALRQNIYANDMLEDRLYWLRQNFPEENVFAGNIIELEIPHKFDLVMQSAVFSSVPAEEDRMAMAAKMKELLAPGGIILWYDFVYNNPSNNEVKGVTREQVRKYFPGASIQFKKTTLMPPLGRRVGRAYNFINTVFPFLRTHVVGLIQYPATKA